MKLAFHSSQPHGFQQARMMPPVSLVSYQFSKLRLIAAFALRTSNDASVDSTTNFTTNSCQHVHWSVARDEVSAEDRC